MLQFVTGRAGSGKTEYLRRMLVDMSGESNSANGSLNCEQKLMMIVPEQYSFETERSILHLAGAKSANQINVLSFTRLAELVFRTEGGVAGERLSDGGRRILMNIAIEENIESLELYKNAAKSGRVTDTMLHAVSELKMCGISEAELETAISELPEGALAEKLSEIKLIYSTFESLVANSYFDSRDDLTRLEERLKTSSFFEGMTVAVDSFEGFTQQELKVLAQIMQKADKLVISLCTDGIYRKGTGIFDLVNRTRERISSLAEDVGVSVLPDIVLGENVRHKNEALKAVEAGLFRVNESFANENNSVSIAELPDAHAEAEFIASTIRNLVKEKGYHYNDFTVVCRSPERYCGVLDVEMKKREIPCFISESKRVDAEPVMRFVIGALVAITKSFATEEILEMLKTGVSGLSADEISKLENYAYLWKLKGSQWKMDFDRHPEGFGTDFTEANERELKKLNALRSKVVEPLLKFQRRTRQTTGKEITKALYSMLVDFKLDENLHAYCSRLETAGEEQLAAKQVRIWELLIEILEQMAEVIGDREISRDKYLSLLREVISGEDISEIPMMLDSVLFGTPEQVRQSSPRVTFIIGASQGDFPLVPRSSGVFSDFERKLLINEIKLPLSDSLEQKIIEERYLTYSVASLSSERLYVSFPKFVDGDEKEPSELINMLEDIFPGLKRTGVQSLEEKANSWESAFSSYAAMFRAQSKEAASLECVFANKEEYKGKLEALERAADSKPAKIEDRELSKSFFKENPVFSASQIETFHKCPFMYFCQYGLRAREKRPAEVDVMQYGTIMHYIFEMIFSGAYDGKQPAEMSEAELEMLTLQLIKDYAETSMGGWESISGREKYRLGRMAKSAALLVRHVSEELAQSCFKPEHFELVLGEDKNYPPLKIKTAEGVTTVIGTIDRVDIYRQTDYKGKEKTYVRVIDYKTGVKKFELLDVLYGLNMQMLVYLAALIESGKELPAGVLYMPSATPGIPAKRGDDVARIKQEADKKLKMHGVVLEDAEILAAMERGVSGRFVPASLKKDGSFSANSSVLSDGEIGQVLDYSKQLIAHMASELAEGDIEAKPILVNTLPCSYCEYAAVCGKEYGEKDKKSEKMSKEDILFKMESEVKNQVPQNEQISLFDMGGEPHA